jgi:glycosyltransferase involved in cell wall biosynthesis
MPLKVGFVYPSPRRALAAEVGAGRAPDTTLLGQNHLGAHGIQASIVDSLLTQVRWRWPFIRRLAWNLREVTAPFEAGPSDVLLTTVANVMPLCARLRRRVQVVVLNYGLCVIYTRSGRTRRRILSASLSSASHVVCLGESQRAELLSQIDLPQERVHVVRLGVDERYFIPRPEADGTGPDVLSAGRDLARDYKTLADALSGLDVRAEIGAFPHNVANISFPRHTRVRWVDIATLRTLYTGAGVIVIPQRADGYRYGSEGGGLTAFLEASAMARPIVATERAILHDYARDGENALLVPAEDPAALREAITTVLGNRELANRLGSAARRRVESELTTRHFAENIAPILHAAAP